MGNTDNLTVSQQLEELATLHHTIIATNFNALSPMGEFTPKVVPEVKFPWIDEPEGSLPIATQNGLNMPDMDGLFHTLVSVTAPSGWDAVIDGINLNVTTNAFTDFSGDIIWQVVLDGRPIDGFQNIANQRGSIQQPMKIHTIKMKTGSTIAILVRHVANVGLAGNIIGGIFGYKYPRLGSST